VDTQRATRAKLRTLVARLATLTQTDVVAAGSRNAVAHGRCGAHDYYVVTRRSMLLMPLLMACGRDDKLPSPPSRVRPAPEPPAPTIEERVVAIGDTSDLSPELQRAFDPAGDFVPMPKPGPNDWLAEHPEQPQSYRDWLDADTHVAAGPRRVIYLLPIGDFPATAPSIETLRSIVHAFFTLEVRMLPAVTVAAVGAKTRINSGTHKRQLLAPDVLKWLAQRVPEDAFGVVAMTMVDLYPQESWNFVFGMASLTARVGVQSFARQDPAFFGEKRDAGWQQLALRRATWTMVHETCHMFGLTHCVYWQCIVAGSNHQAEADSRPLHPCPVCLRKLHAAIEFDPAARETELAKVYGTVGFTDEADWSTRRARWIRDGMR
jgi:archaemetzincin